MGCQLAQTRRKDRIIVPPGLPAGLPSAVQTQILLQQFCQILATRLTDFLDHALLHLNGSLELPVLGKGHRQGLDVLEGDFLLGLEDLLQELQGKMPVADTALGSSRQKTSQGMG